MVSRLGLARSSCGWVGFRVFQLLEVFAVRVDLRVRGFFYIPGFFLEIITFNVFSGTFYAGVDCC